MSEKEIIAFYKERIDWYKRQLEWSDQHLLFLAREIKKREKYDMDRYIRERSKEYRDRQKIRKNIKKYEKLLSERSAIRG